MSTHLGPDGDRAAGARLALSCVSHELSSPLMALYTYLKLAETGRDDDALAPIRACVDRVRVVVEVARAAARTGAAGGAVDLAMVVESAASRLGGGAVTVVGAGRAAIAVDDALLVATAALRAVGQAAAGAAVLARIDRLDSRLRLQVAAAAAAGTTPSWRPVEPWRVAGPGLDLWAAAMVAGGVGGAIRVAEVDGAIAVEIDLPVAAP